MCDDDDDGGNKSTIISQTISVLFMRMQCVCVFVCWVAKETFFPSHHKCSRGHIENGSVEWHDHHNLLLQVWIDVNTWKIIFYKVQLLLFLLVLSIFLLYMHISSCIRIRTPLDTCIALACEIILFSVWLPLPKRLICICSVSTATVWSVMVILISITQNSRRP